MNWSFIFATVVTGLAVVFAVLIFLIVLLKIMGRLLSAKPRKKPAPMQIMPRKDSFKLVAPARPVTVLKPVPRVDELQVIAVITAAIHAYGEQAGKRLRIVDVKKRELNTRSAWGNMGVIESMR
ncbi:MAG: OadG family protein [Oscillospiraceae bacterium]|nr:OadG family protein [Oscillospiraceae bacterium]